MCDHCGCGQTGVQHEHEELIGTKTIEVQKDVLAHNTAHANSLRERLDRLNVRLVNIIGSPGCGKTEMIVSMIGTLSKSVNCVVVEGDLATDNDARRIEKTGVPVYQVQTGSSCHLSAHDVEHALTHLPLESGRSLVIVENVGNLVCPSMFDIGESLRIVCLSTPEGTDKPQKYPVSFREADLAVITKADLLDYVDFDVEACKSMINHIKPGMPCWVTSAKNNSSLKPLVDHLLGLWGD
jgi:hydrogenase nickel incorporation protein HypB